MIAHVAGVPLEELLALVPAVAAGAGLLLARARTVIARTARRRVGAPQSRSRSSTCAR
jgi:hypothetical protein